MRIGAIYTSTKQDVETPLIGESLSSFKSSVWIQEPGKTSAKTAIISLDKGNEPPFQDKKIGFKTRFILEKLYNRAPKNRTFQY